MTTKTRTSIPQEDVNLCENMAPADESVVREIISRVADRWSLWALSELTEYGPLRFSRLLERVEGIRQKSLTATLRHLEWDGLITRTVTAQVPIRVDYAATALGRAMIAQVHPVWLWAVSNLAAFTAARENYDRAQATSSD
ncbi:MAG TPA: helix-turn-helix domain-containing protein [Steroidobacteraceae bacterium]